jgi:hypothetical protein
MSLFDSETLRQNQVRTQRGLQGSHDSASGQFCCPDQKIGWGLSLPTSLHHQLKEVMAYLVVIATATLLGIGAFIVHRTLPKQ